MGNLQMQCSRAVWYLAAEDQSSNSSSSTSSTMSSTASFTPDINVDHDLDLRSTLFNLGYVMWHETLGKGTYAVVKTALCVQTQRQVAIKIIDCSKAPRIFVEHFLPRELATAWNIKHPNIINYYKVIQVKHYTCIVMEKAKRDLLDFIVARPKGSIKEKDIQGMFRGIVKGIEHLHKKQIAHRDLKCENILINVAEEVKVSDFGFARLCLRRKSRFGWKKRMKSETFCGSHPYASPEILSGVPYDPFPADMWSLGVVLYIMLTGEFPYAESQNSEMVEMQQNREWTLPEHLLDKISIECEDLLDGLMEPIPQKRLTATQVLKHPWFKHGNSNTSCHGL